MGFEFYLKKALPFVRFIIKDELQRNKTERLFKFSCFTIIKIQGEKKIYSNMIFPNIEECEVIMMGNYGRLQATEIW